MAQLSICILCGQEFPENSEYCDECQLEIDIRKIESEIEM
jgi:hypothetical protein